MAYNVPVYDVQKFSFGPCVVYLGPAGTTPTVDVGAVRSGARYEVSRTLVDIKQGNPATIVHTFVTEEFGVLTLTGIEWNFNSFARALGMEELSEDDKNQFDFGGFLYVKPVAIKVVHVTPLGSTYTLHLWKARGGERIAFNFTDDPHEFEYTFNSLLALTTWSGEELPPAKQMFRLLKTPSAEDVEEG